MRLVLLAGCLVALAGLALGTTLRPGAHVDPVVVSVPGFAIQAAPGAPAAHPPVAAPAVAAPKVSIAKTNDVEPAPPVVAAPPLSRAPGGADADNPTPKIFAVDRPVCILKPHPDHREKAPDIAICPPPRVTESGAGGQGDGD